MKKSIICFIAAIIFTASTQAQTPQLPAGRPLKPTLPVPTIQPLPPADLVITNIHLVQAAFDNNLKSWVIKVSITIKNTGGVNSSATDIAPFFKKQGKPNWNDMGTRGILIGLRPGEAVTKEYSFGDKLKQILPGSILEFKAEADHSGRLTESNETNNASAVITIPIPQQ